LSSTRKSPDSGPRLRRGDSGARRALLVAVPLLLLILPPGLACANPAHTALAKLSDVDRNALLTAWMQKSGEACDVTSSFFQGFDSLQTAYWNVRCSDGRAFVFGINNDAQGSGKILDCAVLKRLGSAAECFKKF
jgi:hypothetical protein